MRIDANEIAIFKRKKTVKREDLDIPLSVKVKLLEKQIMSLEDKIMSLENKIKKINYEFRG